MVGKSGNKHGPGRPPGKRHVDPIDQKSEVKIETKASLKRKRSVPAKLLHGVTFVDQLESHAPAKKKIDGNGTPVSILKRPRGRPPLSNRAGTAYVLAGRVGRGRARGLGRLNRAPIAVRGLGRVNYKKRGFRGSGRAYVSTTDKVQPQITAPEPIETELLTQQVISYLMRHDPMSAPDLVNCHPGSTTSQMQAILDSLQILGVVITVIPRDRPIQKHHRHAGPPRYYTLPGYSFCPVQDPLPHPLRDLRTAIETKQKEVLATEARIAQLEVQCIDCTHIIFIGD